MSDIKVGGWDVRVGGDRVGDVEVIEHNWVSGIGYFDIEIYQPDGNKYFSVNDLIYDFGVDDAGTTVGLNVVHDNHEHNIDAVVGAMKGRSNFFSSGVDRDEISDALSAVYSEVGSTLKERYGLDNIGLDGSSQAELHAIAFILMDKPKGDDVDFDKALEEGTEILKNLNAENEIEP